MELDRNFQARLELAEELGAAKSHIKRLLEIIEKREPGYLNWIDLKRAKDFLEVGYQKAVS